MYLSPMPCCLQPTKLHLSLVCHSLSNLISALLPLISHISIFQLCLPHSGQTLLSSPNSPSLEHLLRHSYCSSALLAYSRPIHQSAYPHSPAPPLSPIPSKLYPNPSNWFILDGFYVIPPTLYHQQKSSSPKDKSCPLVPCVIALPSIIFSTAWFPQQHHLFIFNTFLSSDT